MGVDRLPDAQIQIQLKTRSNIVDRDRFAKASLQCPPARDRGLEAKAAEELSQLLGHRGVAALNFDAVRTTPRLPQTVNLPQSKCVQPWSAVKAGPAYPFGGSVAALPAVRERRQVGVTHRPGFADVLKGTRCGLSGFERLPVFRAPLC
jgi:hypothetical protein